MVVVEEQQVQQVIRVLRELKDHKVLHLLLRGQRGPLVPKGLKDRKDRLLLHLEQQGNLSQGVEGGDLPQRGCQVTSPWNPRWPPRAS